MLKRLWNALKYRAIIVAFVAILHHNYRTMFRLQKNLCTYIPEQDLLQASSCIKCNMGSNDSLQKVLYQSNELDEQKDYTVIVWRTDDLDKS